MAILTGTSGDDVLCSTTANETLSGFGGTDTYVFDIGFGSDFITSEDFSAATVDTIHFGAGILPGDLQVYRDSANARDLIVQVGTNQIRIDDQYTGTSSTSGIYGQIAQITFEDSSDVIDLLTSGTFWLGTTGNDTMIGDSNADSLSGGLGDDVMTTGSGNDILDGGDGNDSITAQNGDDTITGGAGNDTLNGGTGTDTYVFELGFGSDFITGEDFTQTTMDTIHFGAGILPGDVQIYRDAANARDLIVQVGTNQIRIDDQYTGTATTSGIYGQISQITFEDSSDVIDLLTSGTFWLGTTGNDTMIGDSNADILSGGSGDDVMTTGSGNDILDGGDGNDSITAQNGDDTITGGAGNDTLSGGTGTDTYLFETGFGSDFITGEDFTTATVDTVHLGAGMLPSDIQYYRDPSNGRDLIIEISGGGTITVDDQFTSTGLNFGRYLQVAQITFEDTPSIINFATDGLLWGGTSGDDSILGSNLDDMLGGGSGNDTLLGGLGNDTLNGGAGDDTLNGSSGTDTYVFDAGFGSDFITGEDFSAATVDTIHFGTGILPEDLQIYRDATNPRDLIVQVGSDQIRIDDQYTGTSSTSGIYGQIANITFEDSTDVIDLLSSGTFWMGTTGNDTMIGDLNADNLSGGLGDDVMTTGNGDDVLDGGDGNDTINAQNGDDTITGGAGDDTLSGAAGADTYLFEMGFGSDFITGEDFSAATVDTVHLGSGMLPSDIQYYRDPTNGRDLIIEISGGGTITVDDQFTGTGLNSGRYLQVAQITFEDTSSIIDFATDGLLWDGTSGGDAILGSNLDDMLGGGGGNDTLLGGNGDDTLNGGAGDDVLNGSSGTDIYVFEVGFGSDFITGEDFTLATMDTIHFGAGILPEDLMLMRDPANGRDLLITVGGNQIRVDDQFVGPNIGSGVYAQIALITFEDTSFTIDPTANGVFIWPGDPASTNVFGTSFKDLLSGNDGDDLIDASGGDDTIYGGAGNDTLRSGNGNDTVDAGSGNDTGFGGGGNDVLNGGDGNDLLEGNAGDDTLNGNAGNDILRGNIGEDTIDGGAGNDIVIGGDGNDTLLGGAGDDTLNGFSDSDVVDGGDGNDLVLGGAGADMLFGAGGEDILRGEGGNDEMHGGADNDLMFGSAGEDTLFGGSGDDVIEGNTQADILNGDAGNDTLRGGDGFDILNGGADNDTLVGGNGNDTLDGGSGLDVLRGLSGNDVFVFANDTDSAFGAADLIDGIEGIGIAGGDVIDLAGIDADTTLAGDQAFTFLGALTTAAGLAAGAGALWLESAGGQTRVYGNVDGDNNIDFAVRINDGAVLESDYVAADFVL